MKWLSRTLVCGLLLSTLLVAACAGSMAQDESQPVAASTLVASATPEPPATARVPGTPTVTPSPSPTVTLEPTTEPSPTTEPTATTVPSTETPDPTVSARPTFVFPQATPTAKGPKISELEFSTATDEEIDLALESQTYRTPFPLRTPPDYPGRELYGIMANSEIADMSFEGGYHVIYKGVFYYLDNQGNRQEFDVPLLMTRDEHDLIRTTMFAIPRRMDDGNLILFSYSRFLTEPITPASMLLNIPVDEVETYPELDLPPNSLGPYEFLAPILEQLGFDREDLDRFVQTGDPSHLPEVDGRRFLPVPWMYIDR